MELDFIEAVLFGTGTGRNGSPARHGDGPGKIRKGRDLTLMFMAPEN